MEKTSLHVFNVPLTGFPICMTWTKFQGPDNGPWGPFSGENFNPGDQNFQDQNSGVSTTALHLR